MQKFLLRVIVNAIAIAITASILPGIHVLNNDVGTLLIIGLVFGIINALVRPLMMLLTCPFIILTLGLFILVINALVLQLTASLSGGRLTIESFWWAVLGGLVMAIIGMILENVLGIRKEDKERKLKRKGIITINNND